MNKYKVLTIIGTRPQFIKLEPLSSLFAKSKLIKEVVVNTGQHYDFNLSDVFFKELQLPKVRYYLGVNKKTRQEQLSDCRFKLKKIINRENPDLIIVYGDTNSTLAGALAARESNIPLCHIEAGLRSYNKNMLEETNRVITDSIADVLFVPIKEAVSNLNKEGIFKNICICGDVMFDMVKKYSHKIDDKFKKLKCLLPINKNNYCYMTIHRRENINNRKNLELILKYASGLPFKIVFAVHPHTKKKIEEFKLKKTAGNFIYIKPQSYLASLALIKSSFCVLTDSGGVQREAYMLKVPCLTLRNQTEWGNTVNSGWNKLVEINEGSLKRIKSLVLNFKKPNTYEPLFGRGNSAQLIFNGIKNFLVDNEI